MTLKGKIALITGSSRGIGREIAFAFAREGIDVVVNYHKNKQEAEKTASIVRDLGVRSITIQCDVSSGSAVTKMLEEINQEFGKIDILINNAAIVHKDLLENMTESAWDQVMDVNLKSAFLVTQACLPHMRANQWGRIINISSVAAVTGGVTGPIYVASKAGMLGLTRSYAALLVKEGITANSIAPALIDTDMLRSLNVTPEKIPLGRFGTVEEVADVAVMMVKNGYLTGQTIHLNGGWYFT